MKKKKKKLVLLVFQKWSPNLIMQQIRKGKLLSWDWNAGFLDQNGFRKAKHLDFYLNQAMWGSPITC